MAVNDRNTSARIGGVIGAALGGGFGGWFAVHYGNAILAGISGGIGALVGWYVGWRLPDRSSQLHRIEARLNVVLGTLCALFGLFGIVALWSSGDQRLILGALLLVLVGSAVLAIGLRRRQ